MGEKGLHTEIGQRGTEKYRRQISAVDPLPAEIIGSSVQKLPVLPELLIIFRRKKLRELRILHGERPGLHLPGTARIGVKKIHTVPLPVVDPTEGASAADRPVDRAGVNPEYIFDLIQELVGISRLPVKLVDKGEDRDMPKDTDLKKLYGLRLHSLCPVDHHHRTVRRHQCPVGVLRKVLMPRRIQDIDAFPVIIELEGGGGHGDPSLLLDLHPVGNRVLCRLPSLDGSGELYRSPIEKELLRQCRLPGIRMRNNRECPSLFNLFP